MKKNVNAIFGTRGLFLALCAALPVLPQTPKSSVAVVSVPFVGCASFGQSESREAPKGVSRDVRISARDADRLAYYESADGIGLLGPRGWFCQAASGSGGRVLYLGPKPINWRGPGWGGQEGPAIELNYTLCENSGRYEIAEMIARVFPTYKARATSVWDGMFERPLPSGPYPKDSLRYRSKSMVEFTTPAQTEGLGNFDSWLKKADLPIVGAAMLVFDSVCELPQMVRVSVRVPPELVPLRETMVRFVELRAAEAIVK